MDTKKLKEIRQRLSNECANLATSINRSRVAANEIKVENTEDEGDLATMSHDRELINNLREGDFSRLRLIQNAIKAIDRGEYGECVRCGKDISEKRLVAVPWALMCIRCKEAAEATEAERGHMVPAGMEGEEMEF